MPFCTSCGAEIPADKKFCVQCGAPIEQVNASAATVTSAAPNVPATPPSYYGTPPLQLKKPGTSIIIGGVVVLIVIIAVVYFVGMPMLKGNHKSSDGFVQSQTPLVTPTIMQTAVPTLQYTTSIPETIPTTVMVMDARLEEDYEQVYTLNQTFAFGQKVNFAHELIHPPLYIHFNLTPTIITRHRLVSIGTNNEHYINTTETSPYAWFEVKVLDAGSGAVIDQQGFGNDYPDITKQSFMVRQRGNYRIEMSGNDVNADVQILVGTK